MPQSSVAVQVRVMTLACGQVPSATLSLWMITGAGSQLSVAVALLVAVELLSASHSTVVFAGQVMPGAVVCTAVMS